MFPCDCGTIPHSLERNKSFLKHNLNSSTRPISVQKVRKLPGVFKQVVDMFNRLFNLDAVPPLHSSKNPPRNLMLYVLCSQVVSHQCPAMVQSVTVEVAFYFIVEVQNIIFNWNYNLMNNGSTYNVEWVRAAEHSSWPKKMQHIELKAKLQTISSNAFFFHLLSLPQEKYVCSPLSCVPVLHSQQTMLWRNEVLQRSAIFLTKHPLQPNKMLSFISWWLLLS